MLRIKNNPVLLQGVNNKSKEQVNPQPLETLTYSVQSGEKASFT